MDKQRAQRIVDSPSAVLDWYDGCVQAVFLEGHTYSWYMFAVGRASTFRRHCLVELDRAAFDDAPALDLRTDRALLRAGAALLARRVSDVFFEIDSDHSGVLRVSRIPGREINAFKLKSARQLYEQPFLDDPLAPRP